MTDAMTDAMTERIATDDLERLRRIGELLEAGLNLAGIAMVLDLEDTNDRLRADNTRMRADRRRSRP